MKKVQRYIADDGSEFGDEGACIGYEALCKEVSEIMSKLTPIPDLPSCAFANGAGYLQHDPVVALAARKALLKIANTITPHPWFDQSIAQDTVHPSWAGRMIGEMSERCLSSAWHRFACMTPGCREFGQPYFASHPDEAKDICLNPVRP